MAAAVIPMVAGGLYEGVKALYSMGTDVNAFINSHISEMKASDAPSVARSGRVLEEAKVGFGVGYVTPVVIIGAGQLMLGSPLAAGMTAFTAVTLTNPVAMTCAAVGAIYWGWSALSKNEQEELLQTLSNGFQIGIEFVRSVIRFVVERTKDLIGEKNLEELKSWITEAHKQVKEILKSVVDSVGDGAGSAMDAASESLGAAAEATASYWRKLKAAIQDRKAKDGAQAAT